MDIRRSNNNVILIILCIIIILMAVGYASFSQLLTINGTANISNSWCVGFDNTKTNAYTAETGISGGKEPTGLITFDGNTCESNYQPHAVLTTDFTQPGDEIIYTLTIKNKSTVSAAIKSIDIDGESVTKNTVKTKGNIVYKINMPESTNLSPEEETTMTIKVTFQDETAIDTGYKGESNTLDVKVNVEQGENGFTPVDGSYTVTYNNTENGGTENQTANIDYYDNVDLSKTGVKEGWTFVGWNTDKNAHVGLTKYKMPEKDAVLYAIFKKDITITYEKDNGVKELSKETDSFTIYNNEAHQINLPTMTLKNDNYTKNGYYKDDVFIGNDNEPYTFSDNATVQVKTNGLPVMRSYSSFVSSNNWLNTAPDFHKTGIREKITEIEFVDLDNTTFTVPTEINNTTVWDVSEEQNKSVIAWQDGTKIYIGGKGGVIANTDSSYLFNNFTALTSITFGNNYDTSNATNMRAMFDGCSNLTSLDLSSFDTSNVTSMRAMFANCPDLTSLDLSSFDTSKVTSMKAMFYNCSSLTILDLGENFDTSSVITMNGMFFNCSSLTSLNLGDKFDTSSVTDMVHMFRNCSSLTELDLSTFDTSKVTVMSDMINGCTNLQTVYASDKFVTEGVTGSVTMFTGTTKLIGGNGTAVSVKKVYDKTYAKIDEEGQEGYFTSYLQPKIATVATTNSIRVVVTMDASYGNITKYEFSKDDGVTFVDNGTNNLYTFTSLTKNKAYPIVVRVTDKNGETYTSYKRSVTTKNFNAATFKQINNSETDVDVKITFPAGCGDNLTCTYSKDGGENVAVTETEITLKFATAGDLTTSVTDGNNTVGSTYTISGMPTNTTLHGVNILVAKQGDGLYDNEDNSYTYKGSNPNNYIELNGETWRIMSFNSDGTIKVIRDKSIGTKVFDPGYATAITGITNESSVEGTRYSDDSEAFCNAAETSYAGCKVWGSKNTMRDSNGNLLLDPETDTAKMPRIADNSVTYNLPEDESYLNVYLNGGTYKGINVSSWYDTWSQTLPANESSKILTNHLWDVGLVEYTKNQKLAEDIEQEKAYTWQGTVGLMSASEYVRASTNNTCLGVYNYRATSACYSSGATHNYLFKSENGWTITPYSVAAINQAWGTSSTYIYYNRSVVSAYNVRPALYLSSDVVLTGDGTINNKYKIS